MKNIIEQIKKIEGVKTIEQAGKDMAVVVFEPEKKKQAVRCTTQYEWDFVNKVVHGGKIETKFGGRCPDGSGIYDTIRLDELGVQNQSWYRDNGYQVISFSEFLDQRGLVLEFTEFIYTVVADLFVKPKVSAHLNPDDLIEGEIYFAEKGNQRVESIFRYKCTNLNEQNFGKSKCPFVKYQPIRHATPEEKQKLIKAEVKHGYFHELRTS